MVQGISDRYWQAEARTEETKRFIRDIKRITRRKFTPEEKIRIVLEGFRRDTPIRDICRREGIRPSTYYAWLKEFMEAGKERLQHDTVRDATRTEVGELKRENARLKQLVPSYLSRYMFLKKRLYPGWNKREVCSSGCTRESRDTYAGD